jgi:cyclohexa-1,5-dienecarbonyl-CoA hydratase
VTLPDASSLVQVDRLEEGAVWRVRFGGSKGNILHRRVLEVLEATFRRAGEEARLKAVCLEGEGRHFSFGASVEEHLPGQVEEMLRGFRGALLALFDSSVIFVAAVRGSCLGGGLELACCCNRIVASSDAKLGQPEIALGVFAPVASVLLSERVGRPKAEELCLSGRVLGADEALEIGLVDDVVPDPTAAANAWISEHLLARSASSLRFANRALRAGLLRRFETDLAGVERIYRDELMQTRDATEGLRAFLEKRPPDWKDS